MRMANGDAMSPLGRAMIGVGLGALLAVPSARAEEPLPSWNPGPARDAILRFVADTTQSGGPGFVPPAERIAVFDNDGTLWSEQPFYFQLAFALDRVRVLAPAIPSGRSRSPVLAFGNSDGDYQMLQWTAAGEGRRFMGIVHHTDAAREWAYDRRSHVGRLDKALDEATAKGWTVVDMRKDWKRIHPNER